MRAFYFAPEDNRLRYGDGREIVVGETHTVDATPKCCEVGLHASKRVIDALKYAPSPNLYIVELGGEIDENDDKVSAQARRYIASIDTTAILRDFAKRQALINIKLIKPYAKDYDVIMAFLEGDESKREAAWAAAEAAWAAARAAEWTAARSAARVAAAEAAARAAEGTAWPAAEAAARAAWTAWTAWPAAEAAARAAEGTAAGTAARTAAWAAAEAANDMLTEMIEEALGMKIGELE
tara:strand:- start:806 stop:1519 length:714 start_codon:yes stop_codon:yes gene_type:complete